MRVGIFCSRARSQGLVLASPKRSLHLWHPREQKNSLAFQATAGECALRPAQGTRAGGPTVSGGDRAAKARLPGAPSLAEGPGRVFWLGLDHGGSEPGWVPMQRANRSLSRNACGQKGWECAPEFPASLYVLCPRLPGENSRKAPGDAGCRGICGRTRHTCAGLTLSPSQALGFFRVQCDALRSGDLVDSEGSASRESLTGKGQSLQ